MLDRDLLALVRIAPRGIVGTSACGLGILASYVAQGVLIARILAGVFAGVSIGDLVGELIAVLAVIGVRVVLLLLRARSQQFTADEMKLRLRRRLFDHLRVVGPGYLTSSRTGDVKASLVDGVEGMEAYASKYLPQLVICLLGPIPLVVVLAFISWPVALIVGLCIAAVPTLPLLWKKLLARRGAGHWSSYATLTAEFIDAMQGLATLKALSAETEARQRLDRHTQRLYVDTMRQLKVSLVDPGLVGFATIAGSSFGAVVAAIGVLTGTLTVFEMFAILLLARECFRPFAELSGYWHAGYLGISAAGSIARFLEEPTRRAVRSGSDDELFPSRDGHPPVALTGVSFTYPGASAPAIADLSLAIETNRKVAIVGASGAGKSTLVSLLNGNLRADSGTVAIFGSPITNWSAAQLSSMVSCVWQDTYLFHGSIRDNLLLARPDASAEQLNAVIRAAGLDQLIDSLPAGLDSAVGEHGAQLSGGQRQRVAIARALLADTPIVLLDEATSALDAEREGQIGDALRSLSEGRTTIVIAHRLSTIRDADEIVVLDRGTVAERGTHAELSVAAGQFADLARDAEVLA